MNRTRLIRRDIADAIGRARTLLEVVNQRVSTRRLAAGAGGTRWAAQRAVSRTGMADG